MNEIKEELLFGLKKRYIDAIIEILSKALKLKEH